ncbi:MAG: hypothetical protein D4R45_02215 [Planctomycetaceae bacterium]|nr:MAG: hypothetical protein D4R45_02215 [Planctomycetaceae bacterium]
MKEPETNQSLGAAVLKIVESQLRENDPPETRQTYERLIEEGHSKSEAKRLIACVVTSEIYDVMKEEKPFSHKRFVDALNKLPAMSWE